MVQQDHVVNRLSAKHGATKCHRWLSAQHGATRCQSGGCLHSMVQQDVIVKWVSAQHGATRCCSQYVVCKA